MRDGQKPEWGMPIRMSDGAEYCSGCPVRVVLDPSKEPEAAAQDDGEEPFISVSYPLASEPPVRGARSC